MAATMTSQESTEQTDIDILSKQISDDLRNRMDIINNTSNPKLIHMCYKKSRNFHNTRMIKVYIGDNIYRINTITFYGILGTKFHFSSITDYKLCFKIPIIGKNIHLQNCIDIEWK